MPIRASKTVQIEPAVEHDTALPIRVVRTSPIGGGQEIVLAATSPLAPRSLTSEEQSLISLIASLSAAWVAMSGGSGAATLFVGLALYLLLRELTRRFLPPRE